MTHYNPDDFEHLNLTEIDSSHLTNQQWFEQIHDYLENVMSMNPQQIRSEFTKRFPELLEGDLI